LPYASPPRIKSEKKMTARAEKILVAVTIAALAATAMASETINYSYDARGRLVQVKHGGTVNNNVTANYTYDKANNRTNLNVASPNSPPP
jgi:YD repeat-containing protein